MALPKSKPKDCSSYKDRNKPLGTWLPRQEYELFATIADSYGITAASYLRAVVTKVLREEGRRVQTLKY